jgi:hypothetical protein
MVHTHRYINRFLYLVFTLVFSTSVPGQESPTGWWTTYISPSDGYSFSQNPQSLCDAQIEYLDGLITNYLGFQVRVEFKDLYYDNDVLVYKCVGVSILEEGPVGSKNVGDEIQDYIRDIVAVSCPSDQFWNPLNLQCEDLQCFNFSGQNVEGLFGPANTCGSPISGLNCVRDPNWPGSCPDGDGIAVIYNYSCTTWTWTDQACTTGDDWPPGDSCPGGGTMDAFGICEYDSDDDPPCPGNTVRQNGSGNCVCPAGQEWVVAGQTCATPQTPEPPDPDPPDPILPDDDDDGTSNNSDNDIDGDGTPNQDDDDVDGDGTPNEDDDDIDGDGIPNEDDNSPGGAGQNPNDVQCPAGTTYQQGYCQCDRSNEVIIGDRCVSQNPGDNDTDTDGDGIPDGSDPDIDGDGIPNGQDGDSDGDGIPNAEDDNQTGGGTCPQNYIGHQVNEENFVCLPNPAATVGSCDSAVTCQGDAIQCAQLQLVHTNACDLMDELNDDSGIQDAINDQLSGLPDGYGPGGVAGDEVDATGALDYQSTSGSCPADITVSMLGGSIELSFEGICEFAVLMRPFLIAVGLFVGGRIFLGIEV